MPFSTNEHLSVPSFFCSIHMLFYYYVLMAIIFSCLDQIEPRLQYWYQYIAVNIMQITNQPNQTQICALHIQVQSAKSCL